MELGEFLGKIFGHTQEPDKLKIPVSPASKADKAEISRLIEQRKYELAQEPETKREQDMRDAAKESQEATPELLEELAHMKDSYVPDKKFIRQGGRVILARRGGNHIDIAIFGNMDSPDDAGFLEKAKDVERLIVKGGSIGLQIAGNNENREETLRLLQNIAPNVTIVEPENRGMMY